MLTGCDLGPVVAYSSTRRPDAFTWSSSAPVVAEVTAAGLVRARATGWAWIAASAAAASRTSW